MEGEQWCVQGATWNLGGTFALLGISPSMAVTSTRSSALMLFKP